MPIHLKWCVKSKVFCLLIKLQIHAFLLQSRQGKTRLSKYYSAFETDDKRELEADVHKLIVKRDQKCTNFVDYRKYKVVYQRYAWLYFSFVVDPTDNELSYLEIIHLFVELLDKFFDSVCELDLVFNFYKVRFRPLS